MTIPTYTLVVAVDARHLRQLSWTWPTWRRHKPGLLGVPMIVFYDWSQVTEAQVRMVVDRPYLKCVPWPPVQWEIDWGAGTCKWDDPQRAKMLAGFTYVPAINVNTPYWLKLDCDTVAMGNDDWIDPEWFKNEPAIISHKWSFTRPADQFVTLDWWAEERKIYFERPPLNMVPLPGAERIGHKRIISFVGFFRTDFTVKVCNLCKFHCLAWRTPVPSQDGICWYLAQRMGEAVVRVNMKSVGWQQWSNDGNVRKYATLAMESHR